MTRNEFIDVVNSELRYLGDCYLADRIIDAADKYAEERTRWIHISERTPTKEEYIANNGLFIVSDGNRTYTKYFDIYDSMKFGEPSIHGFKADRCIISWMPLPKSCRIESEDEK